MTNKEKFDIINEMQETYSDALEKIKNSSFFYRLSEVIMESMDKDLRPKCFKKIAKDIFDTLDKQIPLTDIVRLHDIFLNKFVCIGKKYIIHQADLNELKYKFHDGREWFEFPDDIVF